jgi:hypothetical protein
VCDGLSVFLSVSISICPSSVCHSNCFYVCVSSHLPVSVRPSIYLHICLSVCLVVWLSGCLSRGLQPVCCHPACPLVRLSAGWRPVCLPACQSVCLPSVRALFVGLACLFVRMQVHLLLPNAGLPCAQAAQLIGLRPLDLGGSGEGANRKLIDARDIGDVSSIRLASCRAPSGPRGAPPLSRLNTMPPVPEPFAITPCHPWQGHASRER